MERLFDEFKPLSGDDWKEKIMADLKGADDAKKLVWKTREGFSVNPYYTEDDLPADALINELPDAFPFRRGNKAHNNWHIRQDIVVKDIRKANHKALDVLMKGITSLGFFIHPRYEPEIEDIENLCENIYADAVELNFGCERNHLKVVEHVVSLVQKYNRKHEDIHGSVDYDPLGEYVLKGTFPVSSGDSFDYANDLIQAAKHLPHFNVITVKGNHYHNAGSTLVQELAFSLAQGVAYLTQLTERGLSINQVAPRLKFQFAIGPDYFMEIAKVRAARQLWAHIVKAYGPCSDSKAHMHIHGVTSNWNKSMYDAYVNMLRTTTEGMAGIIAGVDSLTVQPFNSVYGETTDFSERIARNQQLLLKEESYFDKVVDPAAGSYYIENLTSSIAHEAWKLFLEVQERGGFIEAFKAGFIQDAVRESARERDRKIATRQEILLGSNQYPNASESMSKVVPDQVLNENDRSAKGAAIKPLTLYRGAMAFERLRYQTDRYAQREKRPRVFLITMGSLAMRRARAQFAGNFFGCAGYEIIDNNGFNDTKQAVDAFLKANADVAVVCSSDAEYKILLPELYEQLKDKTLFVVAGYPKEILDELQEKGIRHFIHLRSNVLESLQEFQELLGINN